MKESGSLRIVPDQLFFRDISAGESDAIDIWISNIGKAPITIRYSLPFDSPFELIPNTQSLLPPGLEVKSILKYSAKKSEDKSSILTVSCPNSSIQIPILASPPCARIVKDVNSINLGTIGVGLAFKFSLSLSNIGVKEGSFKLSTSEPSVSFLPVSGVILPGKSIEIGGTIKPTTIGQIEFEIALDVTGCNEKLSPIKVQANAISYSLGLLFEEKDVTELNFGYVYFGQKGIISASIINRGPAKQSFVIHPPRDDPSNSPRASLSSHVDRSDIVFSSLPSEGLLSPHGSFPIKFIFNPPVNHTSIDDIEYSFTHYSFIEVVETGQLFKFVLSGKAVNHYFSCSSVDFSFDKIPLGQKSTQELTISNASIYLPLSVSVSPIAHFRFLPSKVSIPPKGTKAIIIEFFPKNFGDFQVSTSLIICEGLMKRQISLCAQCGEIKEKDFERIPIWKSQENAMYSLLHPDKRYAFGKDEIEQKKSLRKLFDSYVTESANKRRIQTALSSFRERAKKEAEEYLSRTVGKYTKEDVNDLISRSLKNREETLNVDYDTSEKPFDGLTPPDPVFIDRPAPLFISNPQKFGLYQNSDKDNSTIIKSRSKIAIDENVMIKKKFKPKPTTPTEISECSRPLTPAQQLMVITSHQTLNFGQISVFSTVAKSFTVTNNLQQHIIVTMNFDYEELSKSTPQSQIILPRQTAGFDLVFHSRIPHNFLKAVQYVINGHHSFSFNVCAQIVPIDIQLSRSSVDFRFSPDSVTPIIKEYVTIQNKSNTSAEYNWTGLTNSFSISVISGTIDPLKSVNTEISYNPGNKPHDEATLVLNCVGGYPRPLKCIGDVGNPKCSISKKVIGFGLIPIGIMKNNQIRIKNTGDEDAIFSLSYNNVNELTVSPMNGRIPAHDFINLQVSFKSVQPHSFEIPVNIIIAGSQPLVFIVTGQSELPKVSITNNEFEFGRLFVGSSLSLESRIVNSGAIPAILFLDLSSHPDFRIEYSTDLAENGNNDKVNSISPVSDPIFVTKDTNYIGGSVSSSPSQSSLGKESFQDDNDNNSGPGVIYRFYLLENSEIIFNLVFQPTEVGEHSFELPFTMMNIISASSFHLQPIVSAEAVLAPLSLSTSSLDFGISPIFNTDNPHSRPVSRQITLKNEYKDSIKWRFDITPGLFGDPASFTIDPSSGTIDYNSSILVHISFCARVSSPYNIQLPVMVQTTKEESLIGKIQLTAVGTNYVFRMSRQSVFLPIVPLNFKAQEQISIINHAFVEGLLHVQLSINENNFPLKVTFPEGNQLSHTTIQLPVIVSIQSPRPISFSTVVAIIDDHGNSTTFLVSATTDNSIFTIYPFFKGQLVQLKSGSGKPITAESKVCSLATELTSRFINSIDESEYNSIAISNWDPSCDNVSVSFVVRYLNAIVLNTQFSDFPGDLIKNDWGLIHEIISNLSNGKKVINDYEKIETNGVPSSIMKKYESAKKLIRILQSYGVLISSIRPEFLLSKNDFVVFIRNKVTKQILGIDSFNAPEIASFDQKTLNEFLSSKSISTIVMNRIKSYEMQYHNLSIESWMMILMQLFKIFIINKIDPERLNSTPGVSTSIKGIQALASKMLKGDDVLAEISRPTKNLSSSNVFSTAECCLLKWVSIHYSNILGTFEKPIIDFESLRDSIGLCALMKAHTNVYNGSLIEKSLDRQQWESYSYEFTSAIKELKLSFVPRSEEIVDGSRCILALILAHLFEILPRYQPSATVDFTTTLHKIVTKNISISNPSKAEIVYRASLEGSPNFSLINDSITIGPNQTVDFPVQFYARTIKPQMAKLTMNPLKPRFVSNNSNSSLSVPQSDSARGESRMPMFSAPIVIELISAVSISQPDISLSCEGPIYQTTSLSIPIKNFSAVKCKMQAHIKFFKIADENGKPIPQSKPLLQQIQSMIINTGEDNDNLVSGKDNGFSDIIKSHSPFVFCAQDVDFSDDHSKVITQMEFIPISLGSYRCILLLMDDNAGETVIEIIANSTVPSANEVAQSKLKTEAGKKLTYSIPLDLVNTNLIKAIAYSVEKRDSVISQSSDRKFKEQLLRRQHEIESIFKQSFSTQKFSLVNSSSAYFEIPQEIVLIKPSLIENLHKGPSPHQNAVSIVFRPNKAGDYPCHILLVSKYDIRAFQFKGQGIASTKELTLEFSTVSGKSIKQDIPIHNPSHELWTYKVSISGDPAFSVSPRLSVKASSIGQLPVTFSPVKVGQFSAEVSIFNINKESSVVYRIIGTADEPPAEKKISVECQARKHFKQQVELKPFIRSGSCVVTSTVPIIKFPTEVTFENNQLIEPFYFTVYAPRSGLSVGTITFTDPVSKSFIWYIIEIHVNSPNPEQTINVTTIARKCVTVNIPISNPKEKTAQFQVVLSDEDLFGENKLSVPPNSSTNYSLVVSPLKAMKRMSSVYFYSDDDGEFWYSLKVEVTDAPENTLAPLSSAIGKFATAYILLENPLEKPTTVRVENSNPTSFHIVSKRVIQLQPLEKKKVEVRYIPTSVGIKEVADISFRSNETGDWIYKLSGTGKPPQPLSPIIVAASVRSPNSALVLFNNPFPYPAKFSISMSSDNEGDIFNFLLKRKVFSLTSYGEEFQIPFTFSPIEVGQFQAHIIVAFIGPTRNNLEVSSMPGIRWVFPIIGNSLSSTVSDCRQLKCRSHESIDETMSFTLVGETEVFTPEEYSISLGIPQEKDFLRYFLDLRPIHVRKMASSSEIIVSAKFSPKRPIQLSFGISIMNPLSQEWNFQIELNVEKGKPHQTIMIESLLNKSGVATITLPVGIRSQTPFHAYMASGSAIEFTLSHEHGYIEPSISEQTDTPLSVIFSPKMYGKVLKGLLVIDTLDSQYLFEVIGKTPEYMPPVVKTSTIFGEISLDEAKPEQEPKKRRNIIRDNIESVKIAKPRVSTSQNVRK